MNQLTTDDRRVYIRIALDPQMGQIYEQFASMPAAFRNREFLALARAGVLVSASGLAGAHLSTSTASTTPTTASTGSPEGDPPHGAPGGRRHLASFAASMPPTH